MHKRASCQSFGSPSNLSPTVRDHIFITADLATRLKRSGNHEAYFSLLNTFSFSSVITIQHANHTTVTKPFRQITNRDLTSDLLQL